MPHFFINSKNVEKNIAKIDDTENYRHIARALRVRVGEKLLLIDENQIQYETKVREVTSKEIFCDVKNFYPSKRDLEFDLYLAQSPLRSDAQLTVMEKATELGARAVYPVITDNCALNKSVLEKKYEKWQKVMFEACKQCERAKIPTCFEPTSLKEIVKKDFDRIIVLAERSTEISFKKYLANNPIKKGEKILAIIGPEGGFSPSELELLRSLPYARAVSLGPRILRAETAVAAALSVWQSVAGDWQ